MKLKLFFRKLRPFHALKAIGVTIMILPSLAVSSQNLVANGDFESLSPIPIYATAPNTSNPFPSGWSMPTDGTPDVISDYAAPCDLFFNPPGYFPQVCEFDNKFGCQLMMPAATPYSAGHVYMGITTVGESSQFQNSVDFREYLKTTLNVSGGLSAGQCYQLTYWVSLADMSARGSTVQAVITNQNLDNTNDFAGVLNPGSAIWFQPHHTVVDKLGWVKLQFDFVAQGGETFLYIGFFEDQTSSSIETDVSASALTCDHTSGISNSTYLNGNNQTGYYYVDNVSLIATAGLTFIPAYTFNSSNPNISGPFTNANILINGDVTISANTTFSGCTLKCNDGSSIRVPIGKTLTMSNCTLSAGCNNMWDGMIVDGRIEIEGCHIQDAIAALTLNGNTKSWSIKRSSSGAANFFERNLEDIIVNQYSNSTTNVIQATSFDHLTAQLHYPWLSPNGYGTRAITFNGAGSSAAEIIGGSNVNDVCYFLGGTTAIKATYYPVTVNHCFFQNQSDRSIEFIGNNSAHRKLTVLSSTFMQARNHIYAANRTDLTVQGCSFNYALEHSIVWINNRDGELLIGHETNSSLGNLFQFINWCAVAAWGNSTGQTNPFTLANNTNGAYTTIVIANNTVNSTNWSEGITVGEWALGQNVSYHRMVINSNTINSVLNGIQIFNVKGYDAIPNLVSPPDQRISENYVNVSTLVFANGTGIKIANCNGFSVEENGLTSTSPYNYQNRGIHLQNSAYMTTRANTILAGSGIVADNFMLESDIYCNWLVGYSTGFGLVHSYLRTDPSNPHGVPSVADYKNSLPYTAIPWNSDIFVYNSNVSYNSWMWTGAATNLTITYNGNCGTGSLISNMTAANPCNSWWGLPVYGSVGTPVDMAISNDPVAQWCADYTYEIQRRQVGTGDSTVASSNIKKIINAENLFGLEAYQEMQNLLATITPANTVEENYVDVLTVFSDINEEEREPSTGEIDSLIAIAEQQSNEGGPAVLIARSYLTALHNMHFEDERVLISHEIHGTTTLSEPCQIGNESGTWLSFMDEDGNDLGIMDCYIDANGEFVFDPQETSYYSNLHGETPFRIFSKHGSKYTVVGSEFHPLSEWLAASPFNLNLAGASVETDVISIEQQETFAHYTSVTDGGENVYSVGYAVVSSQTDLLIEKRNKNNSLLWSRTYAGPVTGMDTATCVTLDASDNVYLAGKVWNGSSFDLQVLKYDPSGNLVWSSIIADSLMRYHTPQGILVDPGDLSVYISGVATDDENTFTRYTRLLQCLPSSSRHGNVESNSAVPFISTEIFPNPSDGKINIVLNSSSSGTVELFNLEGQVVFSKTVTQSCQIEIPSSVVDGVYLLKFTGDVEVLNEKLVIQRMD